MVIAVAALAVVVTGITIWTVRQDGAGDPRATSSSGSAAPVRPPSDAGSPQRPAAPANGIDPSRYAGTEGAPSDVVTGPAESPVGPIPDSSVGAVTAAWKSRWKVPLKYNTYHRLHSAIVGYPPARGKLHLTVERQGDKSDTVVSVRCIVEHRPNAVTKKLLTAVTDDCFGPALKGAERTAVVDWLTTRDYRRTDPDQAITRQATSLERFDLSVEWAVASMRVSLVGRP